MLVHRLLSAAPGRRPAKLAGCHDASVPIWAGSAAAFWVVGAVRVDIEVDLVDAALVLGMAVAGAPRPVAELGVGDFGEEQAFPVATRRQFGAALAGELKGESLLLSFLMTKDDRSEFARMAVVQTEDLFRCRIACSNRW